jgi:hypothetical protein
MSNLLQDVMQGVADTLITEFGFGCSAVIVTQGAYDPKTGTKAADSEAETAVSCSPPYPFNTDQIDGTAVKREDMKTLVPYTDLSTELKANVDRIKFTSGELSGREWTVVAIAPIYAGEEPAAWEFHLRP